MSAQTKILTPRAIMLTAIFTVLLPLLPMLVSGHWGWWEAWVYAAIYILGFAASRLLAARRHPDLLAERARFMQAQDAKAWDKVLVLLLALGGAVALIVAGLDHLHKWTPPFPLATKLVALVVILLGSLLGSWALIENRFFSGTVRIQTERGHRVVSSGPYRFIRHPGYAGSLLYYLATPVLLDSVWTFIPVLQLMGVLIVRTALEDQTLQAELAGYADYTQRTRYRLIPGIW